MKVLIILGSIRKPSCTRVLAQEIEKSLAKKGCEIEWADLRENPLPIADPDYHHMVSEHPDENVRKLFNQMTWADGVVLATPLYHGSFSGVLKNALDNMVYDIFRNKPVGLLSHGSGVKRCAQPAEHLLPIVRTLFGYPMQCQVASSKADFQTTECQLTIDVERVQDKYRLSINEQPDEPIITDEGIIQRCDSLAEEMVRFYNGKL